MSVSVEDKEEEIVITLPKSNDLEIKVYNPHFMESLGWKGVSVSILNENKEQVGGDQSTSSNTSKLTFPYNQFVYMIKGAEPPVSQTEPSQGLQNDDEAIRTHKRSPGLYGYFSNTLDYLFSIFAKASSQKEPAKEEPPIKTDDTIKQPITGEEPSMLSTSLEKSMEMKPTEITEVPKEPVSEEPPKTVSKEMEIPKTETSEVPKEPVLEEPKKVETMETSEVPKEPVPEEPPKTVSKEMEIPKTEPTEITQPVQAIVPVVPSTIAAKSPSNLFWKISIPKSSNPPKLFEPSDLGGKYEQHFRDILLLSKMEAKSGIYIVGSFYTIQGKKMKLGTVELASHGKNTLSDYLLQVPPLEGTIMDKYKKLYT